MQSLTLNAIKRFYEAKKSDRVNELKHETFYLQISQVKAASAEQKAKGIALKMKVSDGHYRCYAVVTQKILDSYNGEFEENDII